MLLYELIVLDFRGELEERKLAASVMKRVLSKSLWDELVGNVYLCSSY